MKIILTGCNFFSAGNDIQNGTIVLNGAVVESLFSHAGDYSFPSGAELIDAGGLTVLPYEGGKEIIAGNSYNLKAADDNSQIHFEIINGSIFFTKNETAD